MTKVCTKCKISKEPSFYTKDNQRFDKLYPSCKACRSIYIKSDKAKENDRARYFKRAEKLKAYLKNKYFENAKTIKSRVALYRSRNPEKHLHCSLAWQKNNPGKSNARHFRYKAAKLKRIPKWAEIDAIKAFYEACPKGMHVDHIIPLRGKEISGLHVLNNLQYLTPSENCRKGNSVKVGY